MEPVDRGINVQYAIYLVLFSILVGKINSLLTFHFIAKVPAPSSLYVYKYRVPRLENFRRSCWIIWTGAIILSTIVYYIKYSLGLYRQTNKKM